jgi:hypothetical protein
MSSDTFVSRFSRAPYGAAHQAVTGAGLTAATIASWTGSCQVPEDAIPTWQPSWLGAGDLGPFVCVGPRVQRVEHG